MRWIEALGNLGTFGAFVAALLLMRSQLKAFRASEEDRREAREDRIIAQAACVSAYAQITEPSKALVHVHNDSNAPVYACRVYVSLLGSWKEPAEEAADLPDGQFEIAFGTVPAGKQEFPIYDLHPDVTDGDIDMGGPWTHVRFKDSRGFAWIRTETGDLWLDDKEKAPVILGLHDGSPIVLSLPKVPWWRFRERRKIRDHLAEKYR